MVFSWWSTYASTHLRLLYWLLEEEHWPHPQHEARRSASWLAGRLTNHHAPCGLLVTRHVLHASRQHARTVHIGRHLRMPSVIGELCGRRRGKKRDMVCGVECGDGEKERVCDWTNSCILSNRYYYSNRDRNLLSHNSARHTKQRPTWLNTDSLHEQMHGPQA